MICQNCKNNEATSHFHSVINGVVREKYLCSECLKQYNNSFLKNDFLNLTLGFNDNISTDSESRLKCTCCGSTFDKIRKSGRIGCSNCYITFEKQLDNLLLRLGTKNAHVGKRPRNNVIVEDKKTHNSNNIIEDLKKKLKVAIENENYEQAAVLRDEIRLKEKE